MLNTGSWEREGMQIEFSQFCLQFLITGKDMALVSGPGRLMGSPVCDPSPVFPFVYKAIRDGVTELYSTTGIIAN